MSDRREEALSRAMGSAGRTAGVKAADAIVEDAAHKPRGVDLEIVEKVDKANSGVDVVIPNSVRINGAEVLIPDGTSIRISEIGSGDAVLVTLTMFVSSLTIKGE